MVREILKWMKVNFDFYNISFIFTNSQNFTKSLFHSLSSITLLLVIHLLYYSIFILIDYLLTLLFDYLLTLLFDYLLFIRLFIYFITLFTWISKKFEWIFFVVNTLEKILYIFYHFLWYQRKKKEKEKR